MTDKLVNQSKLHVSLGVLLDAMSCVFKEWAKHVCALWVGGILQDPMQSGRDPDQGLSIMLLIEQSNYTEKRIQKNIF